MRKILSVNFIEFPRESTPSSASCVLEPLTGTDRGAPPRPSDGFPKVETSEPAPSNGETLLVVEDEPIVRELACEFLRAEGYRVIEAADGQEGLRAFREHRDPPIALVVTDIVMPQMDGHVMVEWLRSSVPELKVLFTSGYSEEAIAQRGVLNWDVQLLPKPYSASELISRVQQILAETPADACTARPQ